MSSNKKPDTGELLSSIENKNVEYQEYAEEITEDIRETLNEVMGQPILFLGSGISRRYFDAPDWEELLRDMCSNCPEIERDFDFYMQNNDEKEVGEIFSEIYREWAWRDGRSEFPDELFDSDVPSDIYLKYMISKHLKGITPDTPRDAKSIYQDEIRSLQKIVPQAVITTNYDAFLETIFDYERIIGEEILRSDFEHPSQIYKIHGCVSDPESLVLTEDDFKRFNEKKKYLSSKLLTYFAEHPVLIAGYSAQDPNVRDILSDIAKVISPEDGFIDHIYLLQRGDPSEVRSFERRKRISLGNDRSVDVKLIKADSWEWVYDAFASETALGQTDLKWLSRLMNNVYDIVVTEAPRREIQVNYEVLRQRVKEEEETANVFGITPAEENKNSTTNPIFDHPYRPSEMADMLGLDSYRELNQVIDGLAEDSGLDIRKTNNKYHVCFFREDNKVEPRRYSDNAVELLTEYIEDGTCNIDAPPEKIKEMKVKE